MAKYYGVIGFAIPCETPPGVWTEKIIERKYKGDLIRPMQRWEPAEKVNDDMAVSNEISILSDHYADQHWPYIRYAAWGGALWKVKTISFERPRLRLTIGGIYHAKQT